MKNFKRIQKQYDKELNNINLKYEKILIKEIQSFFKKYKKMYGKEFELTFWMWSIFINGLWTNDIHEDKIKVMEKLEWFLENFLLTQSMWWPWLPYNIQISWTSEWKWKWNNNNS